MLQGIPHFPCEDCPRQSNNSLAENKDFNQDDVESYSAPVKERMWFSKPHYLVALGII